MLLIAFFFLMPQGDGTDIQALHVFRANYRILGFFYSQVQ
jgi:hypothetical protein